jgi:signal transduction histidine kinase
VQQKSKEPLTVSGALAKAWPFAGRGRLGLPAKLLVLTILFVMLAEVLIFVPSVANFRIVWLNDRINAARLASLAAGAAADGTVPPMLRDDLLATTRLLSVAIRQHDMRRLVLAPQGSLTVDDSYDIRPLADASPITRFGNRLQQIVDALSVFVTREGRTIRVLGHPLTPEGHALGPSDFVEIVLSEGPLRKAMFEYALNIFLLSIIISVIAAALVYFALIRLLVQPMMAITHSMVRFSQTPEDASLIITPSNRIDEIGTAERELAHMQRELSQMLHQKTRLADLGLAVSKINHDLRNMLSTAQLLSDRLGTVRDATVQSLAPKLIASLDRAISLCNDTLRYGRAEEAAPRRELIKLAPLVDEVVEGLGLPKAMTGWRSEIDGQLHIDADRGHLYRILNNLARNAVQAIETEPSPGVNEIIIRARREDRRVIVELMDTGPGVPEHARSNLFRPFQSGTRQRGGTGLGLAIVAELVHAHGGTIEHVPGPQGAVFRFEIPDRGLAGRM